MKVKKLVSKADKEVKSSDTEGKVLVKKINRWVNSLNK